MAATKPTKAGGEVNPTLIMAAVIATIVVVAAIAYLTLFRGPKSEASPQAQKQSQAMSQDPILMGKAGDK